MTTCQRGDCTSEAVLHITGHNDAVFGRRTITLGTRRHDLTSHTPGGARCLWCAFDEICEAARDIQEQPNV